MAPAAPRSGDAIFANVERVNAELFTLTMVRSCVNCLRIWRRLKKSTNSSIKCNLFVSIPCT
ncbi:hypothetical protein CK203_021419 [Vitis vinifera]|uniref:Uncharacterized protein n=1 Tax=Vitis vinifera TaxID=29760 RepID=A0A438ISI8_VITVI|nr:hypothetical protein CK203_021419 [Vitis vinifera]